MNIIDKFNKHKLFFDNINKKIKKYKKNFSLWEKFRYPIHKGNLINKKDQLFFSFLFFITLIFGSSILIFSLFLLFFFNDDPVSRFFFGPVFFISSLPMFYFGFRAFTESFLIKFSLKEFSKKEISIFEKYGIKNINNINNVNNILNFTLKRTKLKKEDFSDIIEIYNTYQSKIDATVLFFYIRKKLINMYKEKKISKNELQTYTKYFIDNLNIESKTIIRDSYLDIEKNTFNENENLFNKENSIVF